MVCASRAKARVTRDDAVDRVRGRRRGRAGGTGPRRGKWYYAAGHCAAHGLG